MPRHHQVKSKIIARSYIFDMTSRMMELRPAVVSSLGFICGQIEF